MDNKQDVLDNGPFFHGTKAELKIGDLLKEPTVVTWCLMPAGWPVLSVVEAVFTKQRTLLWGMRGWGFA